MPQPCAACSSPHASTISQKIRAGESFTSISLWLDAKGAPITRNALARHAKAHVLGATARPSGPRPMSTDLAEAIRDRVHERMADGELEPSIRDGLAAVKLIDSREARQTDREWQLRLLMALTGNVSGPPALPDPAVQAIEGEFRALLGAGDIDTMPTERGVRREAIRGR